MDDDLFEDKQSEEFDETIFGGTASNQPLTLKVHRIRSREMVVIDWHVDNWPEWENPTIFGRKYDNHIPLTMADVSECDNPSRPVVWGSPQRVGSTSEIKLKPGETTYFGFWLKGKALPRPKGLKAPSWVEWSSHEPVAFQVYMPVRADSPDKLREMKNAEYLKSEILGILREREARRKPQQEKPKEDFIGREKRKNDEARTMRNFYLEELEKDMKEQADKIAQLRARVDLTAKEVEELIEDISLSHETHRDNLRRSMTGEPRA